MAEKMKILLLDIEISPILAAVWGLFKPFIGIQNILGQSEVLCWAAKWHGEEDIHYSARSFTSRRNMIREIHKLLEEADAVVTYNGDNFDLKILNQEFMELGLGPPSPYRSIDLLKTMRRRFRGTSNKLDYWVRKLGLGQKVEHRGAQLWLDCMNGDKEAFEEMITYNIGDVDILEALYDYVLPWIPNHPNYSVHHGTECCTRCGSHSYQSRGTVDLKSGRYQRFRCNSCKGWFRSQKNLATQPRMIEL